MDVEETLYLRYNKGTNTEGVCYEFRRRYKKIRRKAFLTQEAFAKQIGVSYTTVNRWETGKSKPNLKAMKLIDDYCKKNSIDFDVSEEVSD